MNHTISLEQFCQIQDKFNTVMDELHEHFKGTGYISDMKMKFKVESSEGSLDMELRQRQKCNKSPFKINRRRGQKSAL